MKDFVSMGTGNSRYLKSSIPANITFSQLVTMLRNGTFPFDFNGTNPAGIREQGTALSKNNLLSDEVATLLALSEADAVVSNAFKSLFNIANPTATTSKYGRTKLYSGTDSDSEVLAATPKAIKTVYDALMAVTARERIISQIIDTPDASSVTLDFASVELSKYSELVIYFGSRYPINDAIVSVKFPPAWDNNNSDMRRTIRMETCSDELKRATTYRGGDTVYLYNDYFAEYQSISEFTVEIHVPITDDALRQIEENYWSYGFHSYLHAARYANMMICNLNDGWDGSSINLYFSDRYGNGQFEGALVEVYGVQRGV